MRYFAHNRGFTVIEVVILIMVVGILSAALLPKMLSQSTISAEMTGNLIASDIRSVQSVAMTQLSSKSIVFHQGSSAYTAHGLHPEDRTLPGGTIANADYTISFNTFGEPDNPGTFLFSCRENNISVTISSLTGKVTVTH